MKHKYIPIRNTYHMFIDQDIVMRQKLKFMKEYKQKLSMNVL